MYRPEGWKSPYPKEGMAEPEHIPWLVIHGAFEAGADAMLEGLKKRGVKVSSKADLYAIIPYKSGVVKEGWLVFIPEE